MAQSRVPVKIDPKTWVDLYSVTTISVGVQLLIQNTGKDLAILSESILEPVSGVGYNNISVNAYLSSDETPIGAWAFSRLGTTLQVEEG